MGMDLSIYPSLIHDVRWRFGTNFGIQPRDMPNTDNNQLRHQIRTPFGSAAPLAPPRIASDRPYRTRPQGRSRWSTVYTSVLETMCSLQMQLAHLSHASKSVGFGHGGILNTAAEDRVQYFIVAWSLREDGKKTSIPNAR